MHDYLKVLRVDSGYPFIWIYIYTEKTSDGRGVCNLGGIHSKPQLPTNLYHGADIMLALTWASQACHEVIIQVVEQITEAVCLHGKLSASVYWLKIVGELQRPKGKNGLT